MPKIEKIWKGGKSGHVRHCSDRVVERCFVLANGVIVHQFKGQRGRYQRESERVSFPDGEDMSAFRFLQSLSPELKKKIVRMKLNLDDNVQIEVLNLRKRTSIPKDQ